MMIYGLKPEKLTKVPSTLIEIEKAFGNRK